MLTHNIFLVLNYVSILVLFVCSVIIASHDSGKMQKLALLVCFCMLGCCLGYLIRIEGCCAHGLLDGQKLLYAFVTHGMYCMLLFILEYCKFTIPNAVRYLFHTINTIMSFAVLTMDHHQLFYKSYWEVDMGGYFVLEKEYGFLHTVAVALFALYMLAAVAVAVIFSIKNIKRKSKYVWMLLIAVAIPCFSYIIPKVFDLQNDIQPMAFALFMVMVVVMIYRNNLYDVQNLAVKFSQQSLDDALIVVDEKGAYKGCNAHAEQLFPILKNLELDTELSKQSTIFEDFFSKDETQFVFEDKIFDASLKPVHSDAGKLIGNVLWFRDTTIEHKYEKMLQNGTGLQSTADTRQTISFKDELSGISNRRACESHVAELRQMRNLDSITVIDVGINCLKETNDTVGRAAGDELIKATADLITKHFSKYGKCFRIGGDEFMAILENSTAPLESMLSKFNLDVESWAGEHIDTLSISFGIAKGSEFSGKIIDDVLIAAERTMFEKKRDFYEKNGFERRGRYFFMAKQ